jgi:large subunit ribosomal protein L24
MASHIRKDQVVEVIAGDHKGARGKVLRIDRDRGLVVVEGVNMVYRHVRPSKRNPQGGRLQKEAPIHVSNVLPYDTKTGRGRRVHFEVERDAGGKVVLKKRVSQDGNALETLRKTESP